MASISCFAQDFEVTNNGYKLKGAEVKNTGTSFEMSYDPRQKTKSLVDMRIIPDKEFDSIVAKRTKQKNIYSIFYLPEDSNLTHITIKRSFVKKEYIQKIIYVKNLLYITTYKTEYRSVARDITVQTDTIGGFKYKSENNWMAEDSGLLIQGNLTIRDQKFGSLPKPITSSSIERVSKDRELIIFLYAKETQDNKEVTKPKIGK